MGIWPLPPVWSVFICPFYASFYSVTPIFTLSSVSGESLDLLKVFLNILPPLTNSKEQEELMQQLTEFQVGDCPANRLGNREGLLQTKPRVCLEILDPPALLGRPLIAFSLASGR